MKKNQLGFALLEVALVVVVVGLVGVSAFYNVHRYHPTSAGPTPTPSAHQAGWLTYKSAHSPIQFSYPASWKMTEKGASGYELESVTLQGPNNFQMGYTLET